VLLSEPPRLAMSWYSGMAQHMAFESPACSATVE
jgi:hypothetical protein